MSGIFDHIKTYSLTDFNNGQSSIPSTKNQRRLANGVNHDMLIHCRNGNWQGMDIKAIIKRITVIEKSSHVEAPVLPQYGASYPEVIIPPQQGNIGELLFSVCFDLHYGIDDVKRALGAIRAVTHGSATLDGGKGHFNKKTSLMHSASSNNRLNAIYRALLQVMYFLASGTAHEQVKMTQQYLYSTLGGIFSLTNPYCGNMEIIVEDGINCWAEEILDELEYKGFWKFIMGQTRKFKGAYFMKYMHVFCLERRSMHNNKHSDVFIYPSVDHEKGQLCASSNIYANAFSSAYILSIIFETCTEPITQC